MSKCSIKGKVYSDREQLISGLEEVYAGFVQGDDQLRTSNLEVTHDDTFEETSFITLTGSKRPGDRIKNKTNLSFETPVGFLPDDFAGSPQHHIVFLAGGNTVLDRADISGVGRFIKYRPTSGKQHSATIQTFEASTTKGEVSKTNNTSVWNNLGFRANWTLSLEQDESVKLAFEGGAQASMQAPFLDVVRNITTEGKGVSYFKSKCVVVYIDDVRYDGAVSFEVTPNLEVTTPSGIYTCDVCTEIELAAGDGPSGTLQFLFTEEQVATSGRNLYRQARDGDFPHKIKLIVYDKNERLIFEMPEVYLRETEKEAGDAFKNISFNLAPRDTFAGDDWFTKTIEIINIDVGGQEIELSDNSGALLTEDGEPILWN